MLLSFSLLLVALHGSLAAVLRGRRPNIDPGPGTPAIHFVEDAPQQTNSDPDDVLDKVFQKISDALGEVDKRQSSNVQVSEAEMLELINDVNAIGGQLQEWLENGAGSSQPSVSATPRSTLTSRSITGPSTTRAASPSPTTSCMVTVTETYYEYIYADSSMVPKRDPVPTEEVEPSAATVALPSAMTNSLEFEPFAATIAFPSAMTDTLDVSVATSTMTPSMATISSTVRQSTIESVSNDAFSPSETVSSEVPGASSIPTSTLMSTSLSTSPATLQDTPNEGTGIIWQTIPLPP
ncbi:hypothetical protein F5X68DRAFT_259977 [Plectosphaerella plurivora]|uniref:Uncharacterized protein n=1 Tax=Plectosphaerella plurivora TaxID=936078 RepID=A0A9P8VEP9_9PEZI|nr:hypothetical protein F5X68DRAFT_259977 [Plectosphaerella plurivora]